MTTQASNQSAHHIVLSLNVTGGFLADAQLEFADGLNCLIGGRGAGKTTALESPEERKTAHGNPPDWWQRSFTTESEARRWEKDMLAKPGYKGGPGGEGWRYGYTYTITFSTRE